jgi:hypothetical protein
MHANLALLLTFAVALILMRYGHMLIMKPTRGDDWIVGAFGAVLFVAGALMFSVACVGCVSKFFAELD